MNTTGWIRLIGLAFVTAMLAVTSVQCTKVQARTVNDIARDACALFFSQQQGISFEDAARGVCSVREVLDPFIREILKAQQVAASAGDAGDSEADASDGQTNPEQVWIVVKPVCAPPVDASVQDGADE